MITTTLIQIATTTTTTSTATAVAAAREEWSTTTNEPLIPARRGVEAGADGSASDGQQLHPRQSGQHALDTKVKLTRPRTKLVAERHRGCVLLGFERESKIERKEERKRSMVKRESEKR